VLGHRKVPLGMVEPVAKRVRPLPLAGGGGFGPLQPALHCPPLLVCRSDPDLRVRQERQRPVGPLPCVCQLGRQRVSQPLGAQPAGLEPLP
jgi:hypothetical protein